MTYNPSIPGANDDPRASQPKLSQNFTKLNSDFSVNHTPLTQSINSGLHTLVQFEDVQVADPNLASPQSSLYTKTVSAATELFFQNGALASDVTQLTNLPIGTTGTNYSVLTPWGIRLQMGYSTASPVTFQTAFQPGAIILTGILSGEDATNVAFVVGNPTLTGFAYGAKGGTKIYYFVMGTE